jgi:hypothetical protein
MLSDWWKHSEFPSPLYLQFAGLAEIENCRRITHPTPSEMKTHPLVGADVLLPVIAEDCSATVQEFGPIPRLALRPSDRDQFRTEVAKAILKCDLDKVVEHSTAAAVGLLTGTSNWLLRYVVDPGTCALKQIVFATDALTKQVPRANRFHLLILA